MKKIRGIDLMLNKVILYSSEDEAEANFSSAEEAFDFIGDIFIAIVDERLVLDETTEFGKASKPIVDSAKRVMATADTLATFVGEIADVNYEYIWDEVYELIYQIGTEMFTKVVVAHQRKLIISDFVINADGFNIVCKDTGGEEDKTYAFEVESFDELKDISLFFFGGIYAGDYHMEAKSLFGASIRSLFRAITRGDSFEDMHSKFLLMVLKRNFPDKYDKVVQKKIS